MQQWQANFLEITPIFDDLDCILNHKTWLQWPTCQELNQLIPESVANYQGQRLTLVEQNEALLSDGVYYEQRIYQQGLVPTRAHNWHDFFNALMFLLFPNTKKEMNRLHVQHLTTFGHQKRSPCRDAITLLDECGVLVTYCDDEMMQLLTNHQWEQAFVKERNRWGKTISATIIGHANYEKSLNPYIGFTGKALYLKVTADFFKLDSWDKYQYLDTLLSASLETLLQDNSRLFPLPMLGVPGWWPANESSEFYNNEKYFRPKRK